MAVDHVTIVGGTGDEGFGLALRWAFAGIRVTIGSRSKEKGEQAAARLREQLPDANVEGLENTEAVARTGLVVVTVPFDGQAATYKSIADHLQEKAVVVDCTVPVAAAVGGRATRVLGVWEGSAAQQAAALLPKGTRMCAAFQTLAAVALNDLSRELEGDVLVCGSKSGKGLVKDLVEAIPRLRYVDAGALENARIVEPITSLLIGINHRHGVDASGIQITGLS